MQELKPPLFELLQVIRLAFWITIKEMQLLVMVRCGEKLAHLSRVIGESKYSQYLYTPAFKSSISIYLACEKLDASIDLLRLRLKEFQ